MHRCTHAPTTWKSVRRHANPANLRKPSIRSANPHTTSFLLGRFCFCGITVQPSPLSHPTCLTCWDWITAMVKEFTKRSSWLRPASLLAIHSIQALINKKACCHQHKGPTRWLKNKKQEAGWVFIIYVPPFGGRCFMTRIPYLSH